MMKPEPPIYAYLPYQKNDNPSHLLNVERTLQFLNEHPLLLSFYNVGNNASIFLAGTLPFLPSRVWGIDFL
jgi:hypothetical protein